MKNEKEAFVDIARDQVYDGNPIVSNYCSFSEAGLAPNNERILDKDEITEHLIENRGYSEVIFIPEVCQIPVSDIPQSPEEAREWELSFPMVQMVQVDFREDGITLHLFEKRSDAAMETINNINLKNWFTPNFKFQNYIV